MDYYTKELYFNFLGYDTLVWMRNEKLSFVNFLIVVFFSELQFFSHFLICSCLTEVSG